LPQFSSLHHTALDNCVICNVLFAPVFMYCTIIIYNFIHHFW